MVASRLRYSICSFTCSALLLLGVSLHDVEASSCQREVHKKVGDTVEFSSCLPTEWISLARWRYRGLLISDKFKEVSEKHQFTGRLDLNPTDFSLTVRKLTLQDSGDFSFVSEVNDTQRKTVTITLQVHEPITEPPVLTGNSTWSTLNNSCTVFLECSSTSDSSVTYKWTVRNQTRSGSRLQYVIGEQDGDTQFTCTIQNVISEKTASKTMKCSNNTDDQVNFVVLLSAAGGGCLLIVIVVGVAVVVYHCKQNKGGSDSNELTVYADITDIATEDGNSSSTMPCSVYETIDNKGTPFTPGPQTVYDKIQFSRVRKDTVSPYQDIS